MIDAKIMTILATQSFFESSMYIFVLLWTPIIDRFSTNPPPYGIIFSSFMLSIMIGSQLFSILIKTQTTSKILSITMAVAAVSFLVIGTLKVLSTSFTI